MGLKETIAGAVKSGFSALGNLAESVSYLAYSASSTYNPTTGTETRSETSYSVSGLFLEYSKRDIDGQQIKPHDQKFLFQQASLAVRPTLQDRLLRTDGKYWEVISVSEDPAHATWELQMRGLNG